jgi:hypothetical protein
MLLAACADDKRQGCPQDFNQHYPDEVTILSALRQFWIKIQ